MKTTDVYHVVPLLEKILKLDSGELEQLTPDQDLRTLGLNSLSAVELIVELENELDITMEDDDLVLEHLSTLQGIERLLGKYA
ncbi:acyl carrier protein [Paenibacillus jamilae]|uniref:acyl carrier protein n=1 Tax=Paenibacillus TaxID=44249 RepID=UPI00046F51F0|nr:MULTISPECIES: acyl carrier protein [Paenibacillus]APB69873.1 acyl carrier protein [Paenibacillus polymyxa]APB74576.1 acyl carrier protein [Paenibacillus polymyxa]APQ60924.1 acyl carrier protein [Paenibacillus polymyxa]POR24177.1 acyl carrier protein [Paenibacillus polymyxa]QYK63785.1 Phosphopantetheine attachment site [Paenibacillus sp. S25]